MMRICFIVNGFAIGGAEIKLLELVKELKQQYPDKFYIVVCSVGQGGPLEEQFRNLNIKTFVFVKKYKFDVSLIWRVYKLLKKEKIQIVQTTLYYADIIGTYAAKMAGIDKIISWDAMTQPYHYGFKNLLAYRLASKWYSTSVAVSHAIQKKIIEERHVHPDKTMTIHYGVDVHSFQNLNGYTYRKKLGFKKNDIIIGTVARLIEQKGHVYLVEAAKEVAMRFSNVHFLFVGDGPLREILEKKTTRLGLESIIAFLSFRSDVKELMGIFDVFVLPSLFEGLPNVILEAMACEKPIVATRVSGTPEAVIHGKTGLLVPPMDTNALTSAICTLLNNRKQMKEMGKLGRQRVENVFNLKNQIGDFINLYDKIS